MAKFIDYSTDHEAFGIANKLQEKYDFLVHIELGKVKFVREFKKGGKFTKTVSVKYPADIDSSTIYYVLVNDNKWKASEEPQKVVAIMKALLAIPDGGTDFQSANYAKIRRPEVKEYPEILIVTNGNYDWETDKELLVNNPLEEVASNQSE